MFLSNNCTKQSGQFSRNSLRRHIVQNRSNYVWVVETLLRSTSVTIRNALPAVFHVMPSQRFQTYQTNLWAGLTVRTPGRTMFKLQKPLKHRPKLFIQQTGGGACPLVWKWKSSLPGKMMSSEAWICPCAPRVSGIRLQKARALVLSSSAERRRRQADGMVAISRLFVLLTSFTLNGDFSRLIM